MAEIMVQEQFGTSASEAWVVLSDFGGIQAWMPGIDSCEVEGSGVGALRRIVLGGMPVAEKLMAQDDSSHTFSYSIIEGPLPFESHLSTVSVHALDEGHCRVDWVAEFRTQDPAAEVGIGAALQGAYGGALAALKQKLEG